MARGDVENSGELGEVSRRFAQLCAYPSRSCESEGKADAAVVLTSRLAAWTGSAFRYDSAMI